jgi:bifunctional DNA-binding transcriptional regulator/antitoxin component of YhaV-PrlF toxin-antitoxin module
MSKSTDERGRIYLPKDVRERFGEQYRIVELPSHVALFPVDEDPIEGLRAAVGDAFAEAEAGALKTEAREGISREVRTRNARVKRFARRMYDDGDTAQKSSPSTEGRYIRTPT